MKICWTTSRLAVVAAPTAGEAAPAVTTLATAIASSSTTRMPSSIQTSSLAPSMSQPHSSTSRPSSPLTANRTGRGVSSPSATRRQAVSNASATRPMPPYPLRTSVAAAIASSRGPASATATAYH
ncbi:hypothetical protein [Micromonospora sp. NPDC050200]|uniref:hypothetical protein n=1 Tax=Micromonospora sp. NPDC050200 TaxID=3155664 RepID=UPI0034060018